jgi:hypothetical protein
MKFQITWKKRIQILLFNNNSQNIFLWENMLSQVATFFYVIYFMNNINKI